MNHNITTLNLIRNKDFFFVNSQDKRISFKLPTFEDYISNTYLSTFLSLIELDKKKFNADGIKTDYELLLFLIQNQLYTDEVFFMLHQYIPNLNIGIDSFEIDGYQLLPEEIDFILDV